MASHISPQSSFNLVFYGEGLFPVHWDGSPEAYSYDKIDSLIKDLLVSPLFGSGSYLGPDSYQEGGKIQWAHHKEVDYEPVFFFDDAAKKDDVTENDKIIIRGTQLVEGRWVVYYSVSDCPKPLYGIPYELFQERVRIHSPIHSMKRYNILVAGQGTSTVAKEFFASIGLRF